MISPDVGQVAFRWAMFLIAGAGLILLLARPETGTPQFVITILLLIVGVVMAALVFLFVRIKRR